MLGLGALFEDPEAGAEISGIDGASGTGSIGTNGLASGFNALL